VEWWGWCASILGAIVLIAQGIKAAREIIAPALTMREKLDKVLEHDSNDLKKFEEINVKFKQQEVTNQAIITGLVALINHEIDGNGIDGLKNARAELLQHIIERR